MLNWRSKNNRFKKENVFLHHIDYPNIIVIYYLLHVRHGLSILFDPFKYHLFATHGTSIKSTKKKKPTRE